MADSARRVGSRDLGRAAQSRGGRCAWALSSAPGPGALVPGQHDAGRTDIARTKTGDGSASGALRSSLASSPNGFIPGVVIAVFLFVPALLLASATVGSWFMPEISMPVRGGEDGNLGREMVVVLLLAAALLVARWSTFPATLGARMPVTAPFLDFHEDRCPLDRWCLRRPHRGRVPGDVVARRS